MMAARRQWAEAADLDPDVRKALDSPRDVADLPVRATALVFDRSGADGARVVIAADVDINGFSFQPEEGSRLGGSMEFAVAATHLATGRVYHFDQTIEMHLSPETRQRLGVTWYSLSRDFALPFPRREDADHHRHGDGQIEPTLEHPVEGILQRLLEESEDVHAFIHAADDVPHRLDLRVVIVQPICRELLKRLRPLDIFGPLRQPLQRRLDPFELWSWAIIWVGARHAGRLSVRNATVVTVLAALLSAAALASADAFSLIDLEQLQAARAAAAAP